MYEFYDDKNNLSYDITFDHYRYGESNDNDLLVKNTFCLDLTNKYNKITIKLISNRVNEQGFGNINLNMINDNYINVIYIEKLDTNENNINKINTTILNIDKSLSEINDFKNDTQNNIQKINSLILSQRTNYAID